MICPKYYVFAALVAVSACGADTSINQAPEGETPASLQPVDGDLHPEPAEPPKDAANMAAPAMEEPDGELYPEQDNDAADYEGSVVNPPAGDH